ncbi:unnamed protein product [Didymodactylos carnosus]|uniref:RING-type domain-containing protein n=1 Tax=Didymodactylos carnosus TaxID=1234261 RepID=A0A8S2FC42_9BILA|nr:unnamed protein product [Didymodactylos carnosus]
MTSITSSAATRSIRRNSFQNEHNKSLPQTSFKLINNMKMVSYSADDLVAKTITDECNVIVPLTIISSNNFDIHNKNHHRSRLKSFTSISNQNHLSSPTSTENDDESSEIIIVPNDIVMITTDSNLKRQGSLRLMDKKLIQPSSYYENIKLDKIPIQEQQGKEQQTVISPTVSWINSIGEDRIKDEDSTSNSSSDTSDDDDNDNRYDHFIQARVRGAADRRLSLQHVLGLTDTSTSVNSPLSYHTCLICYHDKRLRPLTQCCQSPVCLECLQLYIGTHVNEAKIKIPCPIQECTYILTRDEILGYINHNQELKEKYKRFYADINKEINIKTW